MYSRKLPLFAFVLTLAGILFLTAFRSADAIKEGQPSQTNAPLLGASHEPVLLPDPIGAMRLVAVDVADNLRRTPTTLDWRKAEGPTHKSLDFFKLMREPTKVPDSILHDLRLIGGWGSCNQSLGIDHAGTQGIVMPNGVTDAACNLVTLMDTFQFKAYDYAMFPFLASTNSSEGHNAAFETMKGRVAIGINSYYLLLGTQINPADKSVIFKVAVNLPKEGVFNEVDATIEELIVADVTEAMNLEFDGENSVTSIYAAEVAGMEKMKEIIEALIQGTFNSTMSELMLKSLGFYEVKIGGGAPDFTRSIADSTDLVRDYAGLKLGDAALISAFDGAASAQPYGISTGVIITDNQNYGPGSDYLFNVAKNSFEKSMPQKIIIWLHYYAPNLGAKKMFYKLKVSDDLSKEEAGNALELGYEEYKARVYQGNPQRPENRERLGSCPPGVVDFLGIWRMKPVVTDCIPTYVFNPPGCWGPDKNLLCQVDVSGRQYIMGAMCGFIDGFLDGLTGLMDAAEGLVEFASHVPGTLFWTIDGISVIVSKCVKEGVSWKSYTEGVSEKWKRDVAYFESLASAASAIRAALSDPDMLKKAFNMFFTSLKTTVKDIIFLNGAILAGYTIGGFLFEVVIDFLTAGIGTGAKWISKLNQTSRKIFTNHIGSGFGGMGELAKKAWNSPTASVLRTKCRNGLGCFIGSTLVYTAAGAMPIKDLAPQTFIASSYSESPNNSAFEYVLAYSHADETKPPSDEQKTTFKEDITPETWKWVSLSMMKEDGSGNLKANLLRPIWWLKQNGADAIGSKIWLDIPEMEILGIATVSGHSPCHVDTRKSSFSYDLPYIYRPITGWFERDVPEVWDYEFSTGETISATPNHPFFSEDRQKYVAVGNLEIGEKLKCTGEKTASLVSKVNRENGTEKVYNLEVWEDHNYHVGNIGILVHNSYWDELGDIFKSFKFGFVKAEKIDNKNWVYKVTPQDDPLTGDIEVAELIGEHYQQKIALTKASTAGVDAFTESGAVISIKALTAQSLESNKTNFVTEFGKAMASYRKVQPLDSGIKVELWFKADIATTSQIQELFEAEIDLTIPITNNKDILGKLFYKGPDGIIELTW